MIVLLMEKGEAGEGATVDFELVDHVFAKAEIQECQHVSLWLGANVMVEYEIGEAHALLQQNLSKAQSNLEQNERELAFVRDNVNTTEVGMARVYNYDVQLRRDMADPTAPAAAAAAEARRLPPAPCPPPPPVRPRLENSGGPDRPI